MKFKCLLFCFLISSSGIYAQEVFQKERAVGVSGGVNFSSVNFTPSVNQDMLTGFNVGIMSRWRTERNLGLQVELNFKQQGWEEAFENTATEDYSGLYYRRKMNYIEVPFLSHIYFGGKRVQFFINLGPQIGFLISDKEEENLNGITPQIANEQHGKPIDKKMEWGLCGGPGMEFRTGIGSFLLEGRYYYALGDFYNTKRSDDFSKASSQVISAKLTYLIPY